MSTNEMNNNEITRKIQVVGKGTVIISLPKKWAKRYNIGKNKGQNDKVFLQLLDNGNIIIKPPKAEEKIGITPGKAIIKCNETLSDQHLAQLIVAAYLNGYEQIKLVSNKAIEVEKRNFVEKLTSAVLNGYEVLEETEKTITIQGIMHLQSFNFPNFFQRYQTRLEVMFKDLISYLKSKEEKKKETLERIKHYNGVLNRNYFLLLRALYGGVNDLSVAKAIGIQAWEIIDYYSMIFVGRRIGELIYKIAIAIENVDFTGEKKIIQENIIGNLEIARNNFVTLMKAFHKNDHATASKLYSKYKNYKYVGEKKWSQLLKIKDLSFEEIEALQLVRIVNNYTLQLALFTINKSRKLLDSKNTVKK